MKFDFMPFTLDIKDDYEKLRKNTPIKSADYTFTNVWGWAKHYNISIAFMESIAIIYQQFPIKCYWAPVGNWNDFDFDILKYLPEPCELTEKNNANLINRSECHGFIMDRVPDEFANLVKVKFKNMLEVQETRGQWEYIYNQDDLRNLSGSRYHKKKNHVKNFYKNYGCDYYALHTNTNSKGCIEDVLLLQDEWCKWHDCDASESLKAENEVIGKILSHWDDFDSLFGGALYFEDKMLAFSVAEELNPDSIVIHFEKAHTNYKGSYQAINHTLNNNIDQKYKFVNREQDMDEEGLRKAKESYFPTDFLKKSRLVFNF